MTHDKPGILRATGPIGERPRDFEPETLPALLTALEPASVIGIDVETTGLNPRRDQLRLLTVSHGQATWVLDAERADLRPLLRAIENKILVGHNLAFDLGFLRPLGFAPDRTEDTMLLSQVFYAENGIRHRLLDVTERVLGVTLSKELQRSDWSGDLTTEQLSYAAMDAAVLLPLREKLWEKLREVGCEDAARIECACLPAIVWMGDAGAPIDRDAWLAIAARTEIELKRVVEEMDRIAPPRSGAQGILPGMDDVGWSWNSTKDTLAALQAAGCDVQSTHDNEIGSLDHPLARLLRQHRGLSKLLTSYGPDWLRFVDNGRVYSSWRQIGASSGRMASDSPNMQQIPRGDHRKAIKAPEGKLLVKADYSQVELRIAAFIANDRAMLDAYQQGQDLHILTARGVLGKQEVTGADRQVAKALNFGLLYGMGVPGLRNYAASNYGVTMTPDEAARYHRAFFQQYPGLRSWHQRTRSLHAAESRTLAGRRRVLPDDTSEPVRLNLPVQGTGADGLKRALALLWERREECPGAVPILVCHDEIVLEVEAATAEKAAAWLVRAMRDGMESYIRPVPAEVEVSIGGTWGG